MRAHLTVRLEGSTVIHGVGSADLDATPTGETTEDGEALYRVDYSSLSAMLRTLADSLDGASEAQPISIIGERTLPTPTEEGATDG